MQDVRRSGPDWGAKSNQSASGHFFKIHQRPASCGQNRQGLSLISAQKKFCERQTVVYVLVSPEPRCSAVRCGKKTRVHTRQLWMSNIKSINCPSARSGSLRHTNSRRRAAAVPFAAATFSLPDRLFHAAPTAQCVSICLGGGAEHRRQGHLEGLIFDAVLLRDG